MNWMRQHVQHAKPASDAASVLARYKLGMKAGGAIGGVRILAAANGCPACRALTDCVYDPDSAPVIPIADCVAREGCRCTYAPVMAYELTNWQLDHRPKGAEYAESVLARLRLATRAGGAIGGVTTVAAADSCPACRALVGRVYQPDAAPRIPIDQCTTASGCRCAYSTTMAFEIPGAIVRP